MKPVVAKIEPVAEDAIFQIKVVQLRGTCVSVILLAFCWIRYAEVGSVRIEWTFAELKLIQMRVPSVIRLEDGFMKLFERLIAADLNHAADDLVGELLTGGTTRQEDRNDIQVSR